MLKIRALNEENSSSDSEDESNPKLSKEAQEEQAKEKYHDALKKLRLGEKRDAADLLERLLVDPCLQSPQDDAKQVAPFQQQLQLGCFKILADLYKDEDCKDLSRSKFMYGRAIYADQDENINLYYRLGKVSLEEGDLETAHRAFSYGLQLRPTHWGCLEHLVTTSYAVHDYLGCLKYCAVGLSRDPKFLKGLVFRDLVFNLIPEFKANLKQNNIKHGESLNSSEEYGEGWREKCVAELRKIEATAQDKILNVQRQIVVVTRKIHLNLKSLTVIEVVKEVLAVYEESLGSFDFHNKVELCWKVQDVSIESEEFSRPAVTEESQTEEESQSGAARSRSSSDDKENPAIPSDGASASQQEPGGEKKPTENNNSENSQPLEGQQNTDEAGTKKKSKGNLKWWQMEGKRRSQRVRGHLIPVSPDKAKKDSSFADQLKNLIPTSLLGDDGTVNDRDASKSPEKGRWQKKLNFQYFGTKDEEKHVKELLLKLSSGNCSTLLDLIIETTRFLTENVKCPWPSELRDLFLALYKYYRSHVAFLDAHESELKLIVKDAFVTLTYLEIVFEKYKTELLPGDKSKLELITKELFFLDDCEQLDFELVDPPLAKDFKLRVKWLIVRRLLNIAAILNDEEANANAKVLLLEMETELRQDPITIWTVNETSNLICKDSVSEKSVGIAKLQNSQTVTELYQSHQYESLIEVLQSSIDFREVEKRDLSDIYFYAVALFRIDRVDCIYKSVRLANLALKFQEYNVLAKALFLMEEIWEKMKANFTLQDKRLVVGSLIKILVACEGKPPPQESILCIPWCILHSITFSLEREEPALYLEEDTPPNSILLLQLAHECMTRSEKCCVDGGRLMLYTMKAILQVKKLDEYIAFDETRHCMEQAIFCLYSHPSKKSKSKTLKDHNSTGITLTWEMCPTLYQYYIPDELPEFDSYGNIGGEVEGLFQRLLEIMPSEFKPTEGQDKIMSLIETCKELDVIETSKSFPSAIQDIYYLIGDYHFKTKEWQKATTYYTWDLAVVPSRFDSWAAIALASGEHINKELNHKDLIDFDQILAEAQSIVYCFRNALKFDPANVKLRIEFGSFVYAMHAYCSRLLKHQTEDVDMGRFQRIENAKEEFLKSAFKCFEPIAKDPNIDYANQSEETVEDEMWIHHYMLGKINEKRMFREDPEEFLKHYELAGKLLHDQGAPYPAKMSFSYTPPELAIEALEIYYRIHASILTLAEHADYSLATEKFYLQFIRRLENSPFVKSKQSRGEGGEGKRGRKPAEESASKKEMAEVTSLMKDLLDNTEKLVELNPQTSSTTSAATSTTTTEDETSTDSVKSVPVTEPSTQRSFGLSEFKKRLLEKELREEKLAHATDTVKPEGPSTTSPPNPPTVSPPPEPEVEVDIYEGLNLESNHFYEAFKDVKFGAVVALCLKAMEECIFRYPSHFKSYYRLAHTFMVFLKDAKKAKEYLMGSPELSQRKITGLFGERKANNFFNGIWKNPIDDIDRPGSFPYHMHKIMQLLLDVLSTLNDHQLLVEVVVQLSKVPEKEKKYLTTPDREMFYQQATNCCVGSLKRKISEPGVNFNDLGIEAFETYLKFQKLNPRPNPVLVMLHDIYKAFLRSQSHTEVVPTVDQAVRFFTFQNASLKASRAMAKSNQKNPGDPQKAGGEAPPRKRGRRGARLGSQEAVETSAPYSQDLDMFNLVSAAFEANNFIDDTSPPYHSMIPSVASMYPTMNLGSVQSMINPLLNNVDAMIRLDPRNINLEAMNTADAHSNSMQAQAMSRTGAQNKMPQPAHESNRSARPGITSQARTTSGSAVNDSYPQTSSLSNSQKSSKDQPLPMLKTSNPPASVSKATNLSRPAAPIPKTGFPRSQVNNPKPSLPGTHIPPMSGVPAPIARQTTSGSQPPTSSLQNATRWREQAPSEKHGLFQPRADGSIPPRTSLIPDVPMPPLHPIRINTSPYKTQTTALVQPPPFQFSKQKSSSTTSTTTTITDSHPGRQIPPAAHSHPPRKRPRRSDEDEEEQVVIDLTVKTPEKVPNPPTTVNVVTHYAPSASGMMPTIRPDNPSTSQGPAKREKSYPLPPKKKHQLMFVPDPIPEPRAPHPMFQPKAPAPKFEPKALTPMFKPIAPDPSPPGNAGGDAQDDDDVIWLD